MDSVSNSSTIFEETKAAASVLSAASSESINDVLHLLFSMLVENIDEILKANAKDIESAQKKGLSPAMIDRLMLDEERIKAVAESVRDIAKLPDPVGEVLEETTRPNGLVIKRVSVPIGTLGIIYESRPNVTIDAAALCLKSHNTAVLRGGSESLNSSKALHNIVQQALEANDLPKACVSMIQTSDRSMVGEMLKASDYIDVIVPRGGKGLIERVMNEARMPVFAHLAGNCHTYIDKGVSDVEMVKNVVLNAKLRRTGICGATESLLFDTSLDKEIIKEVLNALLERGCEIVGDDEVMQLDDRVKKASKEDWSTEYLEAKLSAKMVNGVKEAVEHINRYGSHHTDSILSDDRKAVDYFLKNVDSAIVMNNTSTQFADGGEFGMGAEIGIGTGKLHARGPVGVRQLTTFKYNVYGTGQTRP